MAAVRRGQRPSQRQAFTLLELLVVIGIIAFLMGMLLPSLARVRAQSRAVKCANNIRSLCAALTTYASENQGRYPPNEVAPSPGRYWCDVDRIGQYLPNQEPIGVSVGGGVMVCPEDEDSARSYGMNIWASSLVDNNVLQAIPMFGERWKPSSGPSSQLILIAERWSALRWTADTYYAPPTLGFAGNLPGQRFGGGGGISPPVNAGRYGLATSELPFIRHRKANSSQSGTAPVGFVNIGYADGHVALKSEADLVDAATGKSTYDSLWCPHDRDLEP